MTEQEFNKKWGEDVDPYNLSDEELVQFKNDCFEVYETTGFAETFKSPYDDEGEHNGQKFTVLRRAKPYNFNDENDKGDVDLENLPVWLVQFEDGNTAYCYPEEICLLERK